jgi:hypothetical protein
MPCYNLHELDSSLYKRGEVLVAPQELEQRTRSVLTPVATDELANDLAMVMAHLHTLPALEVIQLDDGKLSADFGFSVTFAFVARDILQWRSNNPVC